MQDVITLVFDNLTTDCLHRVAQTCKDMRNSYQSYMCNNVASLIALNESSLYRGINTTYRDNEKRIFITIRAEQAIANLYEEYTPEFYNKRRLRYGIIYPLSIGWFNEFVTRIFQSILRRTPYSGYKLVWE